jgi:hypothetical protein
VDGFPADNNAIGCQQWLRLQAGLWQFRYPSNHLDSAITVNVNLTFPALCGPVSESLHSLASSFLSKETECMDTQASYGVEEKREGGGREIY